MGLGVPQPLTIAALNVSANPRIYTLRFIVAFLLQVFSVGFTGS